MGKEFDIEVGGDNEAADSQVEEHDEDQDEEPEEETVESLKERLAKADAALKKANKEAERYRKRAKVSAEDDEESKETATQDRAHERAVRAAGRAALREAGFTGSAERAKKLLRLIDTREVEFDDDDDPLGLDEQIDDLKEDFPELFRTGEPEPRPGQRRARVHSVDATAGGGRNKTQLSASERIALGLRGGKR